MCNNDFTGVYYTKYKFMKLHIHLFLFVIVNVCQWVKFHNHRIDQFRLKYLLLIDFKCWALIVKAVTMSETIGQVFFKANPQGLNC